MDNIENERSAVYSACRYAVTKLVEGGSSAYITKIDGKWYEVDWKFVLGFLDHELNEGRDLCLTRCCTDQLQ